MSLRAPDDLVTPIDRYLAEQQDTTAVERFSRRHDADLLAPGDRWYADRLPTTAPGPGEQYAFRVDLDQCTGCKSCVAACHSLNGLDEHESWRSVGQLVNGPGMAADASPQLQTVPSGCHHCVDPACLSGCPTNAYEKDPFTGIVKHLDDQCIGCSYCELTCPYEVPRLNKRLGVVRKCDMCADRLAVGEAPACVQGCPTSAITITVVDTQQVVAEALSGGGLVPGAPSSDLTVPTTRYVGRATEHGDDALVAADHHAVHLSRAHPPLAVMLVLTQLSVGAFATTIAGDWLLAGEPSAAAAAAATIAGLVALAASVLHLGRPAMAWRAVLGVGHSWLSREIVAFGAYALVTSAYAAAVLAPGVPRGAVVTLGFAGLVAGAAGVICSALIYVATRRTWWRWKHTFGKFVGSAATTGPLLATAVVLVAGGPGTDLDPLGGAMAVTVLASIVKLSAEAAVLRPGRWATGSDMDRTTRLLLGPLRILTVWRFGLGMLGGIIGPLGVLASVAAGHDPSAGLGVLAVGVLVLALAGELVERYQFFVASVTPRMPGGFRR